MHWKAKSVSTKLTVRPADLDRLGHVNNARVLEYLEASRWEWIAANGLAELGHVVPVVSRVQVDYLRQIPVCELRVDTTLQVPEDDDLELSFRVRFEQVVWGQRGTDAPVFARANLEIAFVDVRSQRLSSVGEYLRVACEPERLERESTVGPNAS